MTQANIGTPINPATTSGTELADQLSDWRDALHSCHSGSTAPSYTTAGMIWYDTSESQYRRVKIYDGTDWITVAVIDITNNIAFPLSADPRYNYPLTAGIANAQTLTLAPAVTVYTDMDVFTMEASLANTSTMTLNINGVGAKAVRKISGGTDVALVANDILAKGRYTLSYDSAANGGAGAFILVQPSLDLAALSGTVTDAQLPARLKANGNSNSVTNLNSATSSGWYIGGGGSSVNFPDTSNGWVVLVSSYTSAYHRQDAYAPWVGLHYMRYQNNGSWSGWTRIYERPDEIQSLIDATFLSSVHVYSGADVNNVTFPVGTVLSCDNDSGTQRNQAAVVRHHASNAVNFDIQGAGTALTGTWRARGARSNQGGSGDQSQQIFQRTA